jgi:hypothetical protein
MHARQGFRRLSPCLARSDGERNRKNLNYVESNIIKIERSPNIQLRFAKSLIGRSAVGGVIRKSAGARVLCARLIPCIKKTAPAGAVQQTGIALITRCAPGEHYLK